jgi:hypothetical protein
LVVQLSRERWFVFRDPRGACLGGCETVERAVGSVGVVLDAPCLDNDLCFDQGREVLGVEQFVADAAVEALDVGALPQRARLDVTTGARRLR